MPLIRAGVVVAGDNDLDDVALENSPCYADCDDPLVLISFCVE